MISVDELKSYSEEEWAVLLFERDPLSNKLSLDEKLDAIRKAIKCGEEEAVIWAASGSRSFQSWMEENQISVKYKSGPQGPPLVLLSSYVAKPPCVTLYEDALKRLSMQCSDEYSDAFFKELILAHEYYHIREERAFRPEMRFTVNNKYGPFRLKQELMQYSEVAANAFSYKVCGASFPPTILDAILLSSYDKTVLDKFLQSLERIRQEINSRKGD